MSGFLTDTLLWTGALIALVLLIRRPVAEIFGPRAAYALWALPMARLLLPPLVLPGWMALDPRPVLEPAFSAADRLATGEHMIAAASGSQTVAVAPLAPAPSILDALAAFDWAGLLVPVWLGGAAIFLARRYALYFQMRRALLAEARPMGEAGRVRLVETAAADGPVAFGVLDKVVALPPGFMAGRDLAARDLALAHELAHHRGHDLLCNMLVQPLFALHWFSPLATLGWRALRRDQEAACDARVIARQPRESRAAYAAVIARFATQPRTARRLALAAAMACPVLGDRSIVQRLRSLAMRDISLRRRWAWRVLISGAALALPLTGSISYAQGDAAAPPAPAPPAPPPPPAPPAPAASAAPLPPAAPEAPAAPRVTATGDGARVILVERRPGEGAGRRVERRMVLRHGADPDAEHRARLEEDMAAGKRVARHMVVAGGGAMSAAERAEFDKEMAVLRQELGKEFGERGEFHKAMREQFGEHGEFRREIALAVAEARATAHAAVRVKAPKVTPRCRSGQREVVETVTARDGQEQISICSAVAIADARKAMASARAEISRTRELSERDRAEALRSLDEAERRIRAD